MSPVVLGTENHCADEDQQQLISQIYYQFGARGSIHVHTSRKVGGSIPDEVKRFIIQMSTRNLSGGKGRPASKADNLTVIFEPIVKKMWEPRFLRTLLASTACYRGSFIFLRYQFHYKKFYLLSLSKLLLLWRLSSS
jgi:hypothetical protein